MRVEGYLDNQLVTILFDSDGRDYFDISVLIGNVVFDWEQFSPLQQEQIKKQIDRNWVQPL